MPIEIKEIVVRAEVKDLESSQTESPTEDRLEVLVEECVEQVLRILRESKER